MNLEICKKCSYRDNYLYAARDYDEETDKWFLTFRDCSYNKEIKIEY